MTSSVSQTLSIYIPRITRKMTSKFITETFESLNFGIVERVDINETANQKFTAHVHFSEWTESPAVEAIQAKIMDKCQQARIVYSKPWYWILLPNHKPISAVEVEENRRAYFEANPVVTGPPQLIRYHANECVDYITDDEPRTMTELDHVVSNEYTEEDFAASDAELLHAIKQSFGDDCDDDVARIVEECNEQYDANDFQIIDHAAMAWNREFPSLG